MTNRRLLNARSGMTVLVLVVGAMFLAACGEVESADRVLVGDPETIPAPNPSKTAIEAPAQDPTGIPDPTSEATAEPDPTAAPTVRPTPEPTVRPTSEPTFEPTAAPTERPTVVPTAQPVAPETSDDETPGSTDVPGGQATPEPVLSPLEAAVANLEARGEGVAMPNLVCFDLQRAQNILQALTDEFFATDTIDASGENRRQIWDRNWVVTAQQPATGERIVGDPLLEVLKDEESDCGPEPVPVMFDMTCLKVDLAQDLLQAQTGRFFASELVDAAALDRTPILRGRWYVVGQEPAPGEVIEEATKPRLRVLNRDEAEVCAPEQ